MKKETKIYTEYCIRNQIAAGGSDDWQIRLGKYDRYLFGITIEKQPTERKQIVDVDNIEAPTDEPKQPVVKETKVGRNDPCPCGSGKKYKNCCGKNQEDLMLRELDYRQSVETMSKDLKELGVSL